MHFDHALWYKFITHLYQECPRDDVEENLLQCIPYVKVRMIGPERVALDIGFGQIKKQQHQFSSLKALECMNDLK